MPSAVSRLRSQSLQNGRGRRRDDAEHRSVAQPVALAPARMIRRAARSIRAIPLRDARRASRVVETTRVHGPLRRAADVHVFDEPDFGVARASELDQVDELIVVDAADDDRVDLEAAEDRRAAGIDAARARDRARPKRARLREAIVPQRVEADGQAVQAGVAQRLRVLARAGRRWSSAPGHESWRARRDVR